MSTTHHQRPQSNTMRAACAAGDCISRWLNSRCFAWLCFLSLAASRCCIAQTAEVATKAAAEKPQDVFGYAPVLTRSIDVWNPPVADQLSGEIIEFDDRTITFLSGGERRELASNRVFDLQPVWRTELAEKAHRLYTERRYREAIEAIPAAVKSNLPRWQQRLLIAEIVDSAVAIGNTKGACGVFLDSLAPNQPPAMLYSSLPLSWTTKAEPDAALRQAAKEWLASGSEHAQLLGASWLLLDQNSDEARAKLQQLQTSKLEPIAALAVAQAWRIVPPNETAAKLPTWFEFRNRMLQPLQLGPTEFLADRLSRVGLTDLAIGQWSRIASLHAESYHRAFEGLQAAQQQLQRLDRIEEAKRLQAWIERLQPANP